MEMLVILSEYIRSIVAGLASSAGCNLFGIVLELLRCLGKHFGGWSSLFQVPRSPLNWDGCRSSSSLSMTSHNPWGAISADCTLSILDDRLLITKTYKAIYTLLFVKKAVLLPCGERSSKFPPTMDFWAGKSYLKWKCLVGKLDS